MAILLETKNLSKEYHNVKAVDSFSISMEEGHIYGIIGPNGAGKQLFQNAGWSGAAYRGRNYSFREQNHRRIPAEDELYD